MDQPGSYHPKWNQTAKDKYDTTYMQNLKMTQINLFTKQKQTHRQKNKLMVMKLERCRMRKIGSLGWHIHTCSFAKSFLTVSNPMDCSMSGIPVFHYSPEFAKIHVHWVNDAIKPFHPLPPSSSPDLNFSKHQGLFQWVGSLHQVTKVLELQH